MMLQKNTQYNLNIIGFYQHIYFDLLSQAKNDMSIFPLRAGRQIVFVLAAHLTICPFWT